MSEDPYIYIYNDINYWVIIIIYLAQSVTTNIVNKLTSLYLNKITTYDNMRTHYYNIYIYIYT